MYAPRLRGTRRMGLNLLEGMGMAQRAIFWRLGEKLRAHRLIALCACLCWRGERGTGWRWSLQLIAYRNVARNTGGAGQHPDF